MLIHCWPCVGVFRIGRRATQSCRATSSTHGTSLSRWYLEFSFRLARGRCSCARCRATVRGMMSAPPAPRSVQLALPWRLCCVFGPVLRSPTVSRLRHFATVFGLPPRSRLSATAEACPPRAHSSHDPAGRWTALLLPGWRACPLAVCHANHCRVTMPGAAVKHLSHRASFHSSEWFAPSKRGIKRPGRSA